MIEESIGGTRLANNNCDDGAFRQSAYRIYPADPDYYHGTPYGAQIQPDSGRLKEWRTNSLRLWPAAVVGHLGDAVVTREAGGPHSRCSGERG